MKIIETKLTDQEQFFYDNAGYSYDPKTQTWEEGRIECAKHLAAVENHVKQSRIRFEWRVDQLCDSSEFSDEKPYYSLYECTALKNGKGIGSLGGIDFGRGNTYRSQPYKRVVEAEIACEDYRESVNQHLAACCDIETV